MRIYIKTARAKKRHGHRRQRINDTGTYTSDRLGLTQNNSSQYHDLTHVDYFIDPNHVRVISHLAISYHAVMILMIMIMILIRIIIIIIIIMGLSFTPLVRGPSKLILLQLQGFELSPLGESKPTEASKRKAANGKICSTSAHHKNVAWQACRIDLPSG